MLTVSINEAELNSIELLRVALSEATTNLRQQAIVNAKHEVVALWLATLIDKLPADWMSDPLNTDFVQWIASTASERHEAGYEFGETVRRYEEATERRLNVAEHIGQLIWQSIQDQKFEGVQTDAGLLNQVSYQARGNKIRGAQDKNTQRLIWKTYRGVVHLGMAIDYCDEYPNHGQDILQLAENYRKGLSHFCPKGTTAPYVPEEEQILFVYCSDTWSPRFRNRGLPFS